MQMMFKGRKAVCIRFILRGGDEFALMESSR